MGLGTRRKTARSSPRRRLLKRRDWRASSSRNSTIIAARRAASHPAFRSLEQQTSSVEAWRCQIDSARVSSRDSASRHFADPTSEDDSWRVEVAATGVASLTHIILRKPRIPPPPHGSAGGCPHRGSETRPQQRPIDRSTPGPSPTSTRPG